MSQCPSERDQLAPSAQKRAQETEGERGTLFQEDSLPPGIVIPIYRTHTHTERYLLSKDFHRYAIKTFECYSTLTLDKKVTVCEIRPSANVSQCIVGFSHDPDYNTANLLK